MPIGSIWVLSTRASLSLPEHPPRERPDGNTGARQDPTLPPGGVAVSAHGAHRDRDGFSIQTLIVAAIAAGAAAIVTSYFWKNGTVVTAAITPVIVALVKEGLQRPLQSEIVRRPVQRVAETRTPRRAPEYAHTGARSRPDEPPPPAWHPLTEAPPADMGPMRTYGRPSRARPWQRRRFQVAIVTGLLAFAIAATVLTVPELVFGGSVAGKGRTTIFSTHKSAKSSSGSDNKDGKSSTDKSQTDTNQQTAPPSQEPQSTQTTTQPQQQAPSQTAPQGGTPAPQQSPAPSAPPASPTP